MRDSIQDEISARIDDAVEKLVLAFLDYYIHYFETLKSDNVEIDESEYFNYEAFVEDTSYSFEVRDMIAEVSDQVNAKLLARLSK